MFNLKRTENDQENKLTVSTPNGYITIAGTGEFVVRIFKDICENSEEFIKEIRENLRGETIESVAVKMRSAGFSEDIVRDFEDSIIWDDLIDC